MSVKQATHVDHLMPRPEWLAKYKEDVIDPGRPIIDAHHHLWDLPERGRFLFDDFVVDLNSGHNVKATVFAQCGSMYRADGPEEMKPIGETEFVVGAAAQSASGNYGPARMCSGIVGTVDMMLGDRAAAVLEAHINAAGGRFRGIRGRTAAHEDPAVQPIRTPLGVMMHDAARKTVACIQKAGLTLDIWCFHTQLEEALDLCRAFPDLPIVINHVGGPMALGALQGKHDEVYPIWLDRMRNLAKLPNVFVKVGGLGMRFTGFEFHTRPVPPGSDELAKTWKRYIDPCIEAFGPSRSMFESNFPVDKGMFSYPVMWNAFKKLTASYSESEKHALFFGTAAKFYRLDIKP